MKSSNLFDVSIGSVVAPAGYGKTQRIVDLVSTSRAEKPFLLLTHTRAGVNALRRRLDKVEVVQSAYRLSTLDAWSQRFVSAFPCRAEYDAASSPEPDYGAIRKAIVRLVLSGAIDQIIIAKYAGVLVDEYQDCDCSQHALVLLLSSLLPTRVFGDPMQSIFEFDCTEILPWDNVVAAFPVVEVLKKPRRWSEAVELGDWLHYARVCLENDQPVDLDTAPKKYAVRLNGDDRLEAEKAAFDRVRGFRHGRTLVIGHTTSANARAVVARRNAGVTMIERMDLPDLVALIERIEAADAEGRLQAILSFAQSVMTRVALGALNKRLNSLRCNRAKNPAKPAEQACLDFLASPSTTTLLGIVSALEASTGSRPIRPELLEAAKEIMALSPGFDHLRRSLAYVQNKRRFSHRNMPRIAIGTTLLLKGLEAENALVLDPDSLEDKRHLYVALTRCSKSLVVISSDAVLNRR